MKSDWKVLLVAERGESGDGWAALDDFEFLYDPYKVGICPSMTPTRWGFVKVPSPLEMKYGPLLGRGPPMSKVVKRKTFYRALRPWAGVSCSDHPKKYSK